MKEFIYSRNAVYEALRAKRRGIFRILVAEGAQEKGRLAEISKLANQQGIRVERVPRTRLDRIHENHQGVVAEASGYPYSDLTDILDAARAKDEQPFLLLLDSLNDPQNFGTLLRTAEAVGVHGVIIPLAHTVEVTPAVVNASSGASEHLRVARSNLAQAIETLPDDLNELKAMLLAERARNERLVQIIKEMETFGYGVKEEATGDRLIVIWQADTEYYNYQVWHLPPPGNHDLEFGPLTFPAYQFPNTALGTEVCRLDILLSAEAPSSREEMRSRFPGPVLYGSRVLNEHTTVITSLYTGCTGEGTLLGDGRTVAVQSFSSERHRGCHCADRDLLSSLADAEAVVLFRDRSGLQVRAGAFAAT